MENKKNKNLGLALIAIFISILSIFISILKFNGANHNSNYLLNGQQTHVSVEPIKHNAYQVSSNGQHSFTLGNKIDGVSDYIFSKIFYFDNTFLDIAINFEYDSLNEDIFFNLILNTDNHEYNLPIFDDTCNYPFIYYNCYEFNFEIYQVDNNEFAFEFSEIYLKDILERNDLVVNFDIISEDYDLFMNFDNEEFNFYDYFYINDFYNSSDYNGTFFNNISLIATKVGAILVATLTPITTLLFVNGKLTIVGASLAMALGVGAVYLIFRMVRGLIKQNERG